MKFLHAALFLSVLCAVAGLAATTPTKTTAKKSTTKVTSKSVKGPVSTASGTKSSASTANKAPTTSHVAAKGKKPAASPAPRRQLTPTSDRYKAIQQALVDKGYLKGEPTGVWDADSVAAMQHFQNDQKQTPNGKITAASLIGLGLGAKSAGAPEAQPLEGHATVGDPSAPVPAPPLATSAPAASQ